MRNVRVIRKLILFTFISFAAVVSTVGQRQLTEVDLSVNGIRSGSSMQKVRSLGKPQRIKSLGLNECANQYERTFYFPGLELSVLGNKGGTRGQVYSLVLTSPRWAIAPRLRIGADKLTVMRTFGRPVYEEGDKLGYVTKENMGFVWFHFRNNKLVRVEMTETLC